MSTADGVAAAHGGSAAEGVGATSSAAHAPTSGLQHERTVLAWRRTSLALLTNGVLLLLHPDATRDGPGAVHLTLAAGAAALALLTAVVGQARRRHLTSRPRTGVAAPSALIALCGGGLALLASAVVVTVLLGH